LWNKTGVEPDSDGAHIRCSLAHGCSCNIFDTRRISPLSSSRSMFATLPSKRLYLPSSPVLLHSFSQSLPTEASFGDFRTQSTQWHL
jgi:hypothetical protein